MAVLVRVQCAECGARMADVVDDADGVAVVTWGDVRLDDGEWRRKRGRQAHRFAEGVPGRFMVACWKEHDRRVGLVDLERVWNLVAKARQDGRIVRMVA